MKKAFVLGFMSLVLSLLSFSVAEASEGLKIVPNKDVCMVTNVYFGRPQIPVVQGGKTYYGCCEMCKTTLTTDASSRTAADPVTGARVDKAKALIAALPDGSVLYFENQTNFAKYKNQMTQNKK